MFRGLLAIVVLVAVSQARTNAVFNMEGTVMGVEKYVVEPLLFLSLTPFFAQMLCRQAEHVVLAVELARGQLHPG